MIFQGFEVTCTIHDITSDDMLESLAVTQLGVKYDIYVYI